MKRRPHSWREMNAGARFFIAVVVLCGISVLTYTVLHGASRDPLKFLCYLVIALVASRLKVNLPGITGTMSVNFLFLLLGVLELSLSETMALGCAAVVVQCFDRDRPVPILRGRSTRRRRRPGSGFLRCGRPSTPVTRSGTRRGGRRRAWIEHTQASCASANTVQHA